MALEDRTRYDPQESEERVFARWLESGRFHPEPEGTAAENYSIAIPPPNVTGALHMGHALNGSIQDTLIRYARMRGKRTKWILGTDHAGIATQTQVERLLQDRGDDPRGDRPRGVRRARVALARAVRQHDHRPVQAARRVVRLRRGALHARRGVRPRRPEGLRRALREGPDLPRQLPRQLGSGLAVGDLGPRGRGPRGHRHPLLRRLSAGVRPRLGHGRDRAPGDDARRHRDRRAPRRRPLHAAGGGDRDPADRRPPAADHRRRLRQARVRHRRAEDHARPRPERLRDRPQARARRADRDRRGRPDDRGRRAASRA